MCNNETFFTRRRYRDKEQSHSPENVVTSAPTFKSDEVKKPISVKTTVKPLSAITATSASRAAKKIDMGAALNYGKSSDLGINSPTHRNTHNEDLFGDEPVAPNASSSRSNNDIIEDIFSSSASADPLDDFDPRAEETVGGDFGDFSSAFGKSEAPSIVPKAVAPILATEFADFSSAFTSQSTAALPPVDNFLFAAPAPTQSSDSLLSGADLFGNSVITSAFTSPTGGNKDLLSDFGDLTLNPIQGEHFRQTIVILERKFSFIQVFKLHAILIF